MAEDIVKQDDGTVAVVETKIVPVESWTPDGLAAELNAVNSELKNFDTIVANRKQYLNDRLVTLQQAQSVMNG